MQLNEEQQRLIEAAQGKPVEVVDPRTSRTYYLLSAEVYSRVRALVEATEVVGEQPPTPPGAAMLPPHPEGEPVRIKIRELPMTPELVEESRNYCRRLGVRRGSCLQEIEDELKLQYFFGGKYVGLLPTKEGGIVVAVGAFDEAFRRQLDGLEAAERKQVVLDYADPWNGSTSFILSPC